MSGRNELPLPQFNIRFRRRDVRDRQLSERMAEDLKRGDVNLSSVIRDLLREWYMFRDATGSMNVPSFLTSQVKVVGMTDDQNGRMYMEELGLEDPNDPLVRGLAGLGVDAWED